MNSNLINHANKVCHIKDKARKNEMVNLEAQDKALLTVLTTYRGLNGLTLLGRCAADFWGLDFGADPLPCFAGDFAGDFFAAPLLGVGGFDFCFGFLGVSWLDILMLFNVQFVIINRFFERQSCSLSFRNFSLIQYYQTTRREHN